VINVKVPVKYCLYTQICGILPTHADAQVFHVAVENNDAIGNTEE